MKNSAEKRTADFPNGYLLCDIAIKEAGDTTGKCAVVCHVNNPESQRPLEYW